MNADLSKNLRVGAGESSSREFDQRLAKAKPKKGYSDVFCHDETRIFARSGDMWIPATICSGIRYLREAIDPPEKYLYIKRIDKKTTEIGR